MNEAEFRKLLEISWQRPLSPAEQARLETWLNTRPEARAFWEEELALAHLLQQLPDVPISSNFTARLLQVLQREAAVPRRGVLSRLFRPAWPGRWVPRLAGTTALLAAVLAGVYLYQQQHRTKLVHDVKVVSNLAALPHPEYLGEIETIQQLPIVLVEYVDLELLAALE